MDFKGLRLLINPPITTVFTGDEPNTTNTTLQTAELEKELDHQYGTKLTMDNSSDEDDKENEAS